MSDCSICLDQHARYTCPACGAKTCSLACVKKHKLRTECTGQVDPAKFISNKELGGNTAAVNRDYNFLLGFERKIQVGKSDLREQAKNVFRRAPAPARGTKRPRVGADEPAEDRRMARVRAAFPGVVATSTKRENTLVVHLPPGMSRSVQNKSGYDRKCGAFTWTVEWVPVRDDGSTGPAFVSFRMKETAALRDAVPLAVLAKTLGADSVDKAALHFYLEDCLRRASGRRRVVPLDGAATIAQALKDRVVLEFPRICVAPNGTVWGAEAAASSGSESDSSDSDSDSSSGSDSNSDSDSASASDSGSDAEEAPQEESSRAPEHAAVETEVPRGESGETAAGTGPEQVAPASSIETA